ncbi:ABC transporter permease subunit [uncultured Clostridium sp.]|uniref:ABC transporter permease n=1 Tax=uncultured Clostridium sp. TaxID=59620 RepID=UPI0028E9E91E|nr:ABC transporter permease [uncultured Clostridium sp.]
MSILINILEQGLIFSIMAVGVYITYRILDFPDLSVDGTFPLGASVTAMCLINAINPFATCLLAFISGGIGGAITGLFHVKLKITNLMSGILVMIALYSINLRIMGKSNIPLFGIDTIFTPVSRPIIIIVIFALASKIILDLFLKTKLGFVLRATGDNEQLVTSLGVNKDMVKVLGLIISNGLVALSGSIMAQYQGFADVGMGTGIVVTGLATVIIGESIFKRINIVKGTTMAILGSVIYKSIIGIALELGLQPTDLKLITVIIVVIALSLNNKKFNFKLRKKVTVGGGALVADK